MYIIRKIVVFKKNTFFWHISILNKWKRYKNKSMGKGDEYE